jgi:glycolate oxidase FAD binding subunit
VLPVLSASRLFSRISTTPRAAEALIRGVSARRSSQRGAAHLPRRFGHPRPGRFSALRGFEASIAYRLRRAARAPAPCGPPRFWRTRRQAGSGARCGTSCLGGTAGGRRVWRISTAPTRAPQSRRRSPAPRPAAPLRLGRGLVWLSSRTRAATPAARGPGRGDARPAATRRWVRAPAEVRAAVDVFETSRRGGVGDDGRIKAAFDPAGCLTQVDCTRYLTMPDHGSSPYHDLRGRPSGERRLTSRCRAVCIYRTAHRVVRLAYVQGACSKLGRRKTVKHLLLLKCH